MALFSITLFLSAALSFVVQPLIAKRLLPYLGGSPAVWSTSLVFFQAALLGGYALAHLLARRALRLQAVVHVTLLVAAALLAAQTWRGGIQPPGAGEAPVPWLLGILAVSVGAPFVALCVNSTLLQRWAALAEPGRDPYVLYRWSNLGSLSGLLAYPFLLEPLLTGRQQGTLWVAGFVACLLLVGVCASRAIRRQALNGPVSEAAVAAGEPIGPGRRQAWVMLAFIPSSLTLGVTSHITTDLASVPLLWVIPLGLYLLSFAITFGPRPSRAVTVAGWAYPVLLVAAFATMARMATVPAIVPLLVHPALLFATGLLAHGALAADRPSPRRLTEFYLLVAAGGVLGGAFNALAAPRLFSSLAEYPVVLLLSAFVLPGLLYRRGTALPDAAWGLGAGVLTLVAGAAASGAAGAGANPSPAVLVAVFLIPALYLTWLRRQWLRFGTGVIAVYLATGVVLARPQTLVLAQVRTFFGVLRVTSEAAGRFHVLRHGTTTHGRQDRRGAAMRRTPLSYYHPHGTIGQVLQAVRARGRPLRVGVVGLGTGTMAAFAREGEHWVFYEIDEAVVRIATTAPWFSYLADAPVEPEIVMGDARVSLTREAPRRFDLLVLDAFSSDSIPVHLMTREAFALYRSHLAPGGLVLTHVSNRHLELEPLVASVAASVGLTSRYQVVVADGRALADGFSSARWVVSAEPATFEEERLAGLPWRDARELEASRVWTDDYSNLASVIVWRW